MLHNAQKEQLSDGCVGRASVMYRVESVSFLLYVNTVACRDYKYSTNNRMQKLVRRVQLRSKRDGKSKRQNGGRHAKER